MNSRKEAIEWVRSNIPILVTNTRGKLINPYDSAHARNQVIDRLGKTIWEEFFEGSPTFIPNGDDATSDFISSDVATRVTYRGFIYEWGTHKKKLGWIKKEKI